MVNKKLANKKAQVSVEILLIVGFILFLFIPLLLSSYSKANEVEWNSAIEKETHLIREITTAAELVYTSSDGTTIKKRIFFPESVDSFSYENPANGGSFLVINDKYGNQITDYTEAIVEFDPGLTGTVNSGYITIIIEKSGSKVLIKKQ